MSNQISLPYPDTDGIIRAPGFIGDVSSARMAELGDISDYVYYSLMLEECFPVLSELFEKIATTEMRHFLLLGKMTIRLGGDPALRTRHTTPFYGRPERIDGKMAEKMITSAIDGEQAAVKRYLCLAKAMCADKAAVALLERIAADEEHHARMLSRAICEL